MLKEINLFVLADDGDYVSSLEVCVSQSESRLLLASLYLEYPLRQERCLFL